MSCSHEHPEGICDHVQDQVEFSLYTQIDTVGVSCLNCSDDAGLVFKPWDRRFEPSCIQSDDDGDLLFHIPFTSSLKITSLSILGPTGHSCPRTMKVFVNQHDFTTIHETLPTQQWELVELIGINVLPEYKTKVPKFSNVQFLSLFVQSHSDQTEISYIGLKGEFTVLKKDPIITLYESAANPKDHAVEHLKNPYAGFTSL